MKGDICMLNLTVERVAKQSLLYSYMLSQPFATYVDAYPVLQNQILLEAEQLQYKEQGETVRVLQQKLSNLAYYDDELDGAFGVLTEHALKKFQTDHHILASGQAEIDTVKAIIKAEINMYMEQLTSLSESIYPGMHSNDVKIAQKALYYFGYYEGEIDGIYGPLTTKALEIAEEEHDLELIQEISQDSLAQLYEEEKKQVDTESENNEAVSKEEEVTEEKADVKPVEKEHTTNADVIQVAHSLIGTPYVWGGTSPSGFDCSGFIQYVYNTQDQTVPRTVSDMWNFATPVDAPSVGDLVFFETYKAGPSHMGIYIGDGKFIHAGTSSGVDVAEMSNSYWEQRYLGAKRVY